MRHRSREFPVYGRLICRTFLGLVTSKTHMLDYVQLCVSIGVRGAQKRGLCGSISVLVPNCCDLIGYGACVSGLSLVDY